MLSILKRMKLSESKSKVYVHVVLAYIALACIIGIPIYLWISSTVTWDTDVVLAPYSNTRIKDNGNMYPQPLTIAEHQFSENDIQTFSFVSTTIFSGSEEVAASILKKGKDPGLGILELHAQGITGKGVNVAFIDHALSLTHKEYASKVTEYFEVGNLKQESSYHAPAMVSIMVGDSVGVAPEANLYFVAVEEQVDAKFNAEALHLIIEENKKLSPESKIKVVGVSSGINIEGFDYKNIDLWDEAVSRATSEGILVIEASAHKNFLFPINLDLDDPNNFETAKIGYAGLPSEMLDGSYRIGVDEDDYIGVPCSNRTSAYTLGENSDTDYQFSSVGGLSFAPPYISGVLALGWQVKPDATAVELVSALHQSAYIHSDGFKIVDPIAFIDLLKSE